MNFQSLDETALLGKTIMSITMSPEKDRIDITTSDGKRYVMLHHQDCCESVAIHDIVGDLQSLVGLPIIAATVKFSNEWPADVEKPEYTDSFTWTTYYFAVASAGVEIRWLGESNGYYGESVDFEEVT